MDQIHAPAPTPDTRATATAGRGGGAGDRGGGGGRGGGRRGRGGGRALLPAPVADARRLPAAVHGPHGPLVRARWTGTGPRDHLCVGVLRETYRWLGRTIQAEAL